MKLTRNIPMVVLALAILFPQLQSPTVAQNRPEIPLLNSSLESVKKTFKIDFEGGTISEYVKFLRTCPNFDDDGRPCPVNILVNQNAKDYALPEIKVTTSMFGALDLLQSCGNEETQINVDQADGDGITTIRLETDYRPSVTVINAKKLLESIEEKDLMEVIDVGLSMQGNASIIELKLHEKTGLLFAKGTPHSTELVHNIVAELMGNSRGQRMGGIMGGMGGMMGGMGGMGMQGMSGGGGMGMGMPGGGMGPGMSGGGMGGGMGGGVGGGPGGMGGSGDDDFEDGGMGGGGGGLYGGSLRGGGLDSGRSSTVPKSSKSKKSTVPPKKRQ